MIAFIDDHSRFIVHAEFFNNATTENTLLAFAAAIRRYGKPQAILTDSDTQFTPARDEQGPFTQWCEGQRIAYARPRDRYKSAINAVQNLRSETLKNKAKINKKKKSSLTCCSMPDAQDLVSLR